MTPVEVLMMFGVILAAGAVGFGLGREEQFTRESHNKAELAAKLLEMSEECMRLQEQGKKPPRSEDWVAGAVWALIELR